MRSSLPSSTRTSVRACIGLLAVIAASGAPLLSQRGRTERDATTFAVKAGRFLTIDTDPIYGGVMLVKNGKIEAIGEDVLIPSGMRVLDFGAATVTPGFVDLHHHASGNMSDINDMVRPINAELRTLDAVRPSDRLIRHTVSGGMTTTLFLPGSGTQISGFGALLKMRPGADLEDMIIRELGAMKVAQGFNPERGSGDLGLTRGGSSKLLTEALSRGKAYAQAWQDFADGKAPQPELQPDLEQLRKVMDHEVPVIIHTAGARDCVATARMFQDVFAVRMILSHGTFNGHWAATALAARKTPVNLGPRMFDMTNDGRVQGICEGYYNAGCTDLSINTDAPVIPPEQLPLQAAMAVRLGLPWRVALEALTLVPAKQIGIDDRVGSLTPGKDADFFVTAGDPLDPRFPPRQVFIEGNIVYRRGDAL